MPGRLTIDKAGRVVIPKGLRDRLKLAPGDSIEIEASENEITLRPVHSAAPLRKKRGIWIYDGGPADASIPNLIERERAKRSRECAE
jgi:AbrB family looped-hinge helix DNA binding protein